MFDERSQAINRGIFPSIPYDMNTELASLSTLCCLKPQSLHLIKNVLDPIFSTALGTNFCTISKPTHLFGFSGCTNPISHHIVRKNEDA